MGVNSSHTTSYLTTSRSERRRDSVGSYNGGGCETSNKPESKAESGGVKWELKSRSVEEILKTLDTIKNDPSLPMPIIEVDPASVDDFQ